MNTLDLSAIRAVAFDLDGTLVDSLPDLAAAANAMRAAFDLPPLPQERIQSHVGDGIGSLVHRALTDSRDGQAATSDWERGYAFFVRYYHEHLDEGTTIYPGVVDALALLRTLQLPLAVVTNKSERLALPLLERLGLRDYFSLVIGGDTLAERKPSAMPLLHTAQVLGVPPAALLMVGDSANDVLTARAAGSPVVAVDYGYADAMELKADLTVDNLARLYDLMKNKSAAQG